MTTNLNPADVQAGVRSAVREWLDANGADIAELIARTVAEAATPTTVHDARVEAVANTVYAVLVKSADSLAVPSICKRVSAAKRGDVRAALRYLEDTGRAEYDGTFWYAKTAPPATYPFALTDHGKDTP